MFGKAADYTRNRALHFGSIGDDIGRSIDPMKTAVSPFGAREGRFVSWKVVQAYLGKLTFYH